MTRSAPAFPHRRHHDHAAAEESSSSHHHRRHHRALLLPPPHPSISLPARARNPSPRAAMATELRIRSIFLSSESKSGNVRKVSLLPPICSACVKGPGEEMLLLLQVLPPPRCRWYLKG
ncbi:uncharacterized protein [Aegilops tauschii subsp. strangulata]|uniref:uncharacterized protein isoform X3 n=1 Tax=Aegilops tauschii subsp. strangulata TaxID=200361 RepID=UPI001ABBE5A0|nr:uncharacterized protein LOC109769675 [Aegilops tauschii subsp. strangulata]